MRCVILYQDNAEVCEGEGDNQKDALADACFNMPEMYKEIWKQDNQEFTCEFHEDF